ncbi:alpha/beta fold hydrolase [Pseudonocardia humida]|uniref:Alpha/beta fold hydrolase n=1 Tax=Pseudonocardia humida TaxID=2800819 RepID=A0ABT0ZS88_9PSEU|nr:alpha/beta hydrolase [Pseudonocardia humida]MCO1653578.1 alpha/beta fold hydrolase [Pseudonocardia humida]
MALARQDDRFADFDRHRRVVDTASGPAGYVDVGDGPVALFVHGVGTSSHLWRRVIDLVDAHRRCIAVDLPAHGSTPVAPDQDLSLGALARFVADVRTALDLGEVDLVANDTGGAVAQIVAARDPARLRSLTLTDCDTHDRVPPKAFLPSVLAARAGLLAPALRRLARDPDRARRRMFGSGYQDPDRLGDDLLREWIRPLATAESARRYQSLIAALRPDDLLAVEPQLARLQVPTLIVWGTDDAFFPLTDAYWLRDTIPGAGEVVELAGARLFFPDERADELAEPLLRHWAATAPTVS